MLQKTVEDGISFKVTLNWSIHAKNSLANVHGFSPYQLALGYTPNLPSVITRKILALENNNDISSNNIIAKHLSAMSYARKAFIENENSEIKKSPNT